MINDEKPFLPFFAKVTQNKYGTSNNQSTNITKIGSNWFISARFNTALMYLMAI